MTDSVTAQQLWFTRPGDAEIRECQLPSPRGDEVLVKVERSAVSAGTELLVYRGQIPDDMALDASIDGLRDATTYPLRYGYACVGQVIALGEAADSSWLGKRVFA
ncbi:MAG TPA: hypothetical protein VM553_05780, partial [Dongiaceae bacterium]|nr:hypothetical protein [Dongiaceae bacterium]